MMQKLGQPFSSGQVLKREQDAYHPDRQMIAHTPVSGTGTTSQVSSSPRSSLGKVTPLDASFKKVHHIISGTI